MDGNHALKNLMEMTEDERKSVRILWFDEGQMENVVCVCDEVDYDDKCRFFENLSNEEKGTLIERGLFTKGGDWTEKHNEFLEDFTERFNNAIKEKMMKTRDGASVLLKQNFNGIVNKITSKSGVFTEDVAELSEDGDESTNNPNIKIYGKNVVTGVSFVECEEEREQADKPWLWWCEGELTEYHFFATLDEAVSGWTENISRIDKVELA